MIREEFESSLVVAYTDTEIQEVTGSPVKLRRQFPDGLSKVADSRRDVLQGDVRVIGLRTSDGGISAVECSVCGCDRLAVVHASPSGSGQVLVTPVTPTRTVGEQSDTRSPSGGVSAPGGGSEHSGPRTTNERPPGP